MAFIIINSSSSSNVAWSGLPAPGAPTSSPSPCFFFFCVATAGFWLLLMLAGCRRTLLRSRVAAKMTLKQNNKKRGKRRSHTRGERERHRRRAKGTTVGKGVAGRLLASPPNTTPVISRSSSSSSPGVVVVYFSCFSAPSHATLVRATCEGRQGWQSVIRAPGKLSSWFCLLEAMRHSVKVLDCVYFE